MPLPERPCLMRYTNRSPMKGWALVADLLTGRVKFAGSLEECYAYLTAHGENLRIMALSNVLHLDSPIVGMKAAIDDARSLSKEVVDDAAKS